MGDKFGQLAKCVSGLTYSVSGGLVIGDLVAFLDNHAGAIGAVLAALTFITNFIFQVLNHRAVKANSRL